MNTKRIVSCLAPPLLALAAVGCTSNMSAVAIEGFEFVSNDGDACVPSGTKLVQGKLDTSVGSTYVVAVKVRNALPENADEKASRLDSNTVYLDTALVSFRTSDNAPFAAPANERVPVSIVVPAGAVADAAMQVLTNVNGASLSGATDGFLIVEVTLTGKTADGAAITSLPAEFPVQLCTNCVNPCNEGEKVTSACSVGQPDGALCGTAAP